MIYLKISGKTHEKIKSAALNGFNGKDTIFHEDGTVEIPLQEDTFDALETYRRSHETMEEAINRLLDKKG